MTKQDLINLLLAGIKESDAGRSDTVTITKRQAMELVSQLLSMKGDEEQALIAKDGQVLRGLRTELLGGRQGRHGML